MSGKNTKTMTKRSTRATFIETKSHLLQMTQMLTEQKFLKKTVMVKKTLKYFIEYNDDDQQVKCFDNSKTMSFIVIDEGLYVK